MYSLGAITNESFMTPLSIKAMVFHSYILYILYIFHKESRFEKIKETCKYKKQQKHK